LSDTPDNDQNVISYPHTYSFTVQFSDPNNSYISASQNLIIRIAKPLVIGDIINFSPEWIVDEEYPEATLQATGGIPPYTWTLASALNTLPPGLSIEEDGTIRGKPDLDSAGEYTFRVEVTDSTNPQQSVVSEDIIIIIYDKLEIITTTIPRDWYLGSPYSATIEANGGKTPYNWELNGQLPPGLLWTEVDENGEEKVVISGTPEYDPSAVYPALYDFNFTVTDTFEDEEYNLEPQTAMKPFSITIHLKDTSAYAQYEGLGDNKATAIAIDSERNVYVTGYSRGKTTGPDFYTVKYDSNLNKIWAERYDGPSHLGDYANDIVVKDYNGNTYVYVTGKSYRGKREKHADYCTLKYDSDGNLIWDKRYDSRRNGEDIANAIAVDDDGNVYVTGKSQESLEKDPVKSFDYLTIKYNSRGRMRWAKRYEGYESTEIATNNEATAIVAKAGYVYVTGISSNGANTDFATIKYDADDGREVWPGEVVRYDGTHGDDGANALAVDDVGNVYVCGYSSNGTNTDFATIKYGPDGNSPWMRTYEGGSNDVATDMVVEAGYIYVTGYSEQIDQEIGLNKDFATIKYDANGNEVWGTLPNGVALCNGGHGADEAVAIFVDSYGEIYVTGTSQGDSSQDYFTLKYNTTGNLIWLARYNSTNSTAGWNDFATALVVDSSGNVYVTGYSQKPGDEKTNYILTVKY
jgi:uncharacterized delta-60 repeat protein